MHWSGSDKNIILRITVAATVIRCVIASCTDLGNDEVYYFTYAVQPDLNHFDHPPLIGFFIRLFTFDLHFISEIFMRMPAIAGSALNTWLIARCAQIIGNRKAGFLAAILYNTSIYSSIISGVFIIPDSVQLVFWLAALYCMLGSIRTDLTPVRNRYILLVGLWTGLAIMSKVHGVFLWAGFLGYIIFYQTSWLKNPYLYLAAFITILIISPIMIWNIRNEFITWRFHSERVTIDNQIVNFKSFLTTTIGQILYCNPFQFIVYVLTVINIISRKHTVKKPYLQLLLWCSLPIICCTTGISLFRQTLPHWSGPGFIGIMLLSSAYLEKQMSEHSTKHYRYLLNACVALMLFVFVAGLLLVNFYPGTMGKMQQPDTGAGDATLDIYGWDQLKLAFEKIRKEDLRTGRMKADAPMLVHQWFPGAHLYYYVAYPLGMRLIGAGDLNNIHKFWWLNARYGAIAPGEDAYYIAPSTNFSDPALLYTGSFRQYEKAGVITQYRNSAIARYWYIYRLKHATCKMGTHP
ncbi:glycosyltransferase family 39 protein [Dyadobacter flavalbus]|uniref:Glycosyltransferase family 39 protein n=1 Tax=Dyadobacter flavalbus TaxID=2579942 RepID=A0A5M8QWR2_9BACT|nr:glycosyltransferase family 39 protein [Dyadobacter flavalbus]KAA6439500.1 glycosyltransferase family 39 protein [Dyadobacter flavalbus]